MVFRNVPVIMMLVVTSLYACGLMVNLVHIPARAMEGGVTNVQSASLLTMFAVVSLITRATHGWFVDRNYINSFTLQQIVILGSAVATFLNPISDSYAFLVGNSIVVGAFTGIGSPLLIYNVRTLASPAQLPSALSLISAVFFLFAGTGTLIAGKLSKCHFPSSGMVSYKLCLSQDVRPTDSFRITHTRNWWLPRRHDKMLLLRCTSKYTPTTPLGHNGGGGYINDKDRTNNTRFILQTHCLQVDSHNWTAPSFHYQTPRVMQKELICYLPIYKSVKYTCTKCFIFFSVFNQGLGIIHKGRSPHFVSISDFLFSWNYRLVRKNKALWTTFKSWTFLPL